MSDEIRVAIAWEPDDQVQALFANHVLITTDGANAYLRFYQVLPPAVASPEAARQVESIKGRHVVTLAINLSDLQNIAGVLQQTLALVTEGTESAQ